MNTVASSEQFPLQPYPNQNSTFKNNFFSIGTLRGHPNLLRNQSTKSTESVESRFNSKYQFFKYHH